MKPERMDDFFNSRVDMYESHMLQIDYANEFYAQTAKALPQTSGVRLLDLGCGTGLELDEYFRLAPDARVTCVDMAEKPLQLLRKKHPDRALEIVNASYFDIDFGAEKFDACVSVESFHHFSYEMKLRLYEKIYSALAKNGVFVETDYVSPDDETERRMFAELADIKKEYGVSETEIVHVDTPHTIKHLLSLRADAGFRSNVVIWRKANTAIIVSRKEQTPEVAPATEYDADELMSVYSQARARIARLGIDQWQYGGGFPPRATVLGDIKQKRLFVARDESGILAAAALCEGLEPEYQNIDGAWLTDGAYMTVHRLAAADRALGVGAKALMDFAVAYAYEKGAKSLRADTHAGNTVMLAFLKKRGFEKCGTVEYAEITDGDKSRVAFEKVL